MTIAWPEPDRPIERTATLFDPPGDLLSNTGQTDALERNGNRANGRKE